MFNVDGENSVLQRFILFIGGSTEPAKMVPATFKDHCVPWTETSLRSSLSD